MCDPRTSQVLSEALKWGSQHPNAILDPFGKRDSPNLLAFSGLFDHLHTLYEEEGHTVGSFVHDEQNEFIKHIREHYELFSKWQFSKHPLSSVADVKMLPTFDCEMVVRSSSQSFGLQLVDICIWLVKRVIDKGDKPRGNCRLLFECLAERSQISRFDFNDLVQNVAAGANYVAKLPLSDEDIEKGRALRDQFEQERISRISGKLPSD